MEKTQLLLIDDHPMMIEGLKSSFSEVADIAITGTAFTAADALLFLQQHPADVVFTDINLPDMNGIELCKKIKLLYPQIKVLALTTFNQYDYITDMLQSGAWGYILKSATRQQLIDAIYTVRAGKKYFSTEVTETLLHRSAQPATSYPRLTRREKEVLQLIAQGFTNQEIADKLFISILTVISHRKNLMTKFEASNTATLMSTAARHGLL